MAKKPINRSGKTLSTQGEICAYLGIGKDAFRKLVLSEDGGIRFPAKKIYGRWFANIDLIDSYMARMTVGDGGDIDFDESDEGLTKCDKCGNFYQNGNTNREKD